MNEFIECLWNLPPLQVFFKYWYIWILIVSILIFCDWRFHSER